MKLHTNFKGIRCPDSAVTGEARRSRRNLAFIFALLACFVAAFSAAAQPLTSSNRYLFIVDTSAGMKVSDVPVREAIFGLIYSGLRGRMTNGDTYGVWLINDRNDTSFPMDTWRSRSAMEMGARATKHVADAGFKGNSRIDVAITDALAVVKNIEDLTIVLVSNGETPISGTPFDDEINARFREIAPKMKRAKTTVNTALVAQNGALVAWAVNSPGFLVDVPYVAPKPKPPKVKVATTTNAPATNVAEAAVTPPPQPAPVIRRSSTPIVITKETVAQEKRSYQAMTAEHSDEPAPANASTIVMTGTKPTVVLETNAPAVPVSNATPPAPVVAATNPAPPVNETTAVVKIESTNAVVVSSAPVLPKAAGAAASPVVSDQGPNPLVWAAIGAASALLCVLLIAVFVRSRRHEPSLISQAIAQDRLG